MLETFSSHLLTHPNDNFMHMQTFGLFYRSAHVSVRKGAESSS